MAVENNDLRLKLKACLDEFDALEAQDKEDTLTHQLQLQSQSEVPESKKDSNSSSTEVTTKEKVCMGISTYFTKNKYMPNVCIVNTL